MQLLTDLNLDIAELETFETFVYENLLTLYEDVEDYLTDVEKSAYSALFSTKSFSDLVKSTYLDCVITYVRNNTTSDILNLGQLFINALTSSLLFYYNDLKVFKKVGLRLFLQFKNAQTGEIHSQYLQGDNISVCVEFPLFVGGVEKKEVCYLSDVDISIALKNLLH